MHGNNVYELFRARALPSQKPSPWCPVLKKISPHLSKSFIYLPLTIIYTRKTLNFIFYNFIDTRKALKKNFALARKFSY